MQRNECGVSMRSTEHSEVYKIKMAESELCREWRKEIEDIWEAIKKERQIVHIDWRMKINVSFVDMKYYLNSFELLKYFGDKLSLQWV